MNDFLQVVGFMACCGGFAFLVIGSVTLVMKVSEHEEKIKNLRSQIDDLHQQIAKMGVK